MAVDMVDTVDTDITVERDLLNPILRPKLKPIPPLSLILKPMLMPGEAMADMADMAVDTVDTVVDTVDMVDTAVVDTVDLLNLTLSLMPLPTMVDTTVLDTDTVVDTDMAVMVVTTVVDTDTGDAKGGPLNLMPMPQLMPGEATMAMADMVDTEDMSVMVTVVDMATTDKCH